MKTFITISTFLFCSNFFACTDFSGKYLFEGDQKATEFTQTGCEKISIVTPKLNMTIMADNNFHEVASQDIIIQGQNIGKMVANARANFNDSELLLDMQVHVEMMGQVKDQESSAVNILLPNGDMQSVTTQNGQTITTIGKKIN